MKFEIIEINQQKVVRKRLWPLGYAEWIRRATKTAIGILDLRRKFHSIHGWGPEMAQAPTTTATQAQKPPLDRLVYFEVKGLFQEFTYRIPINTEKRVTAIIAPNGSGKTICLRLINSLFQQQWSFFAD